MVEITAEGENILHRIGSENYPEIRRIITPNPEAWEEITTSDIPLYTKAEYDAKVAELIRQRYSLDAELAILRQRESKREEFAEYDAYAERCKAKAREELLDSNDSK